MIKHTLSIQSVFASTNLTAELESFRLAAHTALGTTIFAVDLREETNSVDLVLDIQSENQIPLQDIETLTTTHLADSLAALKLKIHSDINAYRDQVQYDNFVYDGARWDIRQESRALITGAVALALANGGNLPADFVFRDYDNINHPFTGTQMIQLGAALFAFTGQCYQASWIHKYCVGILLTAEEVNAYDYAVGWPITDL